MVAKGDGQGGSKKKAKVPKTRADALLVERGLAAHPNEALALILKKAVIADEGKIIVDKASTMLPQVLVVYCDFLVILLHYDLIVDKASTLFCPRLASPSPRARARTHTLALQYNDLYFMNKCNQALLNEYPKIHIFGESAVNTVISQAYFTKNNLAIPFKSNLPGALDFVVEEAMFEALNHDFGWNDGVSRLYTVLAQDLAYADANKNVNFLENHDHHRFFSVIGEDFNKYKMGITWLMTLRGIPHFYYGTEILMKNFKDPSDAEVRRDFPGGWKEDAVNKFDKSGRTEQENLAFDFVKKLANYRKNSDAISNGKFMQFVPQDGVYVYFRYTDKQSVMVVSNTNKIDKILDTSRFEEMLKGSKSATNILSDSKINDISTLNIPAKGVMILEIN